MILTFNSNKYTELLIKYQSKVIKNEAENEQALAIVESLMNKKERTLEEDEMYDLLVTLIEKFEAENYAPGANSSPLSMLLFLMEQKGIKETDLLAIFPSSELISEILTGKKAINQSQAKALSNLFQIDFNLFIS